MQHRQSLLTLAALAACTAAQAQTVTPPKGAPIPDAHPSASVNPPTSAGLKPGMTVKDGNGAAIGTIRQVGQTSGGRPMAQLEIDGRLVSVPAAWLNRTPDGAWAVSTLTKAQILASAPKAAG